MPITCMLRLTHHDLREEGRITTIKRLKATLNMGLKEALQFYEGKNSVICDLNSLQTVLATFNAEFGNTLRFSLDTCDFVPTDHRVSASDLENMIKAERTRNGY